MNKHHFNNVTWLQDKSVLLKRIFDGDQNLVVYTHFFNSWIDWGRLFPDIILSLLIGIKYLAGVITNKRINFHTSWSPQRYTSWDLKAFQKIIGKMLQVNVIGKFELTKVFLNVSFLFLQPARWQFHQNTVIS